MSLKTTDEKLDVFVLAFTYRSKGRAKRYLEHFYLSDYQLVIMYTIYFVYIIFFKIRVFLI